MNANTKKLGRLFMTGLLTLTFAFSGFAVNTPSASAQGGPAAFTTSCYRSVNPILGENGQYELEYGTLVSSYAAASESVGPGGIVTASVHPAPSCAVANLLQHYQ